MSEENVQIVRGVYEAFGNGDVPGVLSKFANDIEWREADNSIYADGNPYIGPTAVLEGVFMQFATGWDNFAVTSGFDLECWRSGDCSWHLYWNLQENREVGPGADGARLGHQRRKGRKVSAIHRHQTIC